MKNKNYSFFSRMICCLIMLTGLLTTNVNAQTIASYTFAQTTGTYKQAGGGAQLTSTSSGFCYDDANFSVITIPFTFTYHGVAFTTITAQQNGFAVLGSSGSGYSAICSGTANLLSPLNNDLYGCTSNGADFTWNVVGGTPNRVLTLQWNKWGIYSSGLNEFSFQIKLYETSNKVQFVYQNGTATGSTTAYVGLTGATGADFQGRTTTSNWSATTASATACGSTCTINAAVRPTNGLIFTWTSAGTVAAMAFTQTIGTYVPIEGGTSTALTTSGCYDDSNFGAGTIPFTFTYHGATFTTITAQNNGFAVLGSSNFGYSAICSGIADVLSPLNYDLYGCTVNGAEASYTTLGTAPNRTFVVQWSNWGFWSSGLNEFSFQIRLQETTNTVQFVYGPAPGTTSNTVYVGLTGATGADFQGRTTTTNWAATTPSGTACGSTCTISPSVRPVNGLAFTWSPPTSTPCSGTPTAASTVAPTSACSAVNFTLSLSNPYTGITGLSYQWQSSTTGCGGSFSNFGGGASTQLISQTVPTCYRCIITCTNSGLSTTATPINVGMGGNCQCLAYGASSATSTADEEIFNVTVGTLNNTSTCATTAPGPGSVNSLYSNYTGAIAAPSLQAGSSISFSLTLGYCGTFNYSNMAAIYIDYNQNGLFTDAGENVYTKAYGSLTFPSGIVSGTFTVPGGATLGTTRMRIVYVESSVINPTGTYTWGETEDYCVNIIPPPPCSGTPSAGTVTGPAGVCASVPFTLTATGVTTATGISYQWQSASSCGGSFTNIGGATSTTFTTTQTVATAYKLYTLCSNSGLSNVSNCVFVPMVTAPPSACTPPASAAPCVYMWITNVTTTGGTSNFNNTTGCAASSYNDFTCTQASIIQGNSLTVSMTSITYAMGLSVWVDYNDNGSFADAGENVLGVYTGALTVSGTFVVSGTAGTHRMRVRAEYAAAPTDPCVGLTYGETEDYGLVITQPPCSGTPAPGNTISSSTYVCTAATNVTLSLQNFTVGSGVTYQWQTSTVGSGGPWTNAGPNASTYTTTQSVITWYRCIVTCSNSGLSGTSTPVQVVMGSSCQCAAYCIPSTYCGFPDIITNVTFAGINHSSGCDGPGAANGWSLYTSPNPTITQGASYAISVSTGGDVEGVTVWIDWNANGTFDASEIVLGPSYAGTNPATYAGSVTVPYGAVIGSTRMRVRCMYAGSTSDPCVAFTYGETEDYCVTIPPLPPCSGTPAPGNTLSSGCSPCPTQSFTLSLQNTLLFTFDYQWQSGPSASGPWTNVGPNSPTYTLTQATATWYQCVVTCPASAISVTSTPVFVGTSPCYCITPIYSFTGYGCNASLGTQNNYIGNVTLAGINNSTGCNAAVAPFYQYFCALTANVQQSGSYSVTISAPSGGAAFQLFKVYIDYNDNGSLDDAGEMVYTSGFISTSNNFTTGFITIPLTAPLGTHRLRVRSTNPLNTFIDANSCSDGAIGEVEDYNITITAAPPCAGTPSPGLTKANAAIACSSSSIVLSLQNHTIGTGITYQWQSAPSNSGPWTNIASAASEGFTTTQSSTTWYRCEVACSGSPGTSVPVQVTSTGPCYCTTPSQGSNGCALGLYINNVTFGALNNTSGCWNPLPYTNPYYSYFPGATATFNPGVSFAYSVSAPPYTAVNYLQYFSMWIDYNDNGSFDDAGELVFSANPNTAINSATGNYTIPAAAPLGYHQLRVRSGNAFLSNSCTISGNSGEVEDYTILIQPCINGVATITPASPSICRGVSVTLTASGSGPYAWSNGATTQAITVTPLNTTTYTVATGIGCTNNGSVTVDIIGGPIAAASVTPSTLQCPGTPRTLDANLIIGPPSTGGNYEVTEITFAPVSGSGTVVSLGDDQVSSMLSIGFPFTFYGNTYTQFCISSNGFISFDPNTSTFNYNGCCSGQFLPDPNVPNNLIALDWEDYYPPGGGTISYFTTGSSPNMKLVVSYSGVPHYPGPASNYPMTGQIVLNQNGTFEIHSTSISVDFDGFSGETMGAENSDGTMAVDVEGWNATDDWDSFNEAWSFAIPVSTPFTYDGPVTYTWSPGPVTCLNADCSQASASPGVTTVYTLTVADNSCSSTSTVNVPVHTPPVVSTTTGSPYCVDNSIGFFTTGSGFAGSGTAGSLTITVTGAGYLDESSWTITNSSSVVIFTSGPLNSFSTNTATVTPSVSDYPITFTIETQGFYNDNVADYSVVCSIGNVTLTSGNIVGGQTFTSSPYSCFTAGGSLSYSWSGPNGFTSLLEDPTIASAILANSGTYTVTVTDGHGCTTTTTTDVIVNPLPVPSTVAINLITCIGANDGSVELSSTGTGDWLFTDGSTFQVTDVGNSINTVTFGPLSPGLYTYHVTDANGCDNALPDLDVFMFEYDPVPPAINCPGNITVNNTTGQCGAVVNYATPVGTDNCPNAVTIQLTGLASGSFFPVGTTPCAFKVTDEFGQTATCSFTVTVVDNESPVITGCPTSFSMCNPISWTIPTITDNCSVSVVASHTPGNFPFGTTTVTYTATDPANHVTTCSFNVTRLEESVAADSISSNRPFNNICSGENITLTLNGGSLGEAGVWKWYSGSGPCGSTLVASGVTSITVAPTATTSYFVRAEGVCNITGCVSAQVVVSTAPPTNSVTITYAPPFGYLGLVDSIVASPVAGATFYLWTKNQPNNPTLTINGSVLPSQTPMNNPQIAFQATQQNYNIKVLAGNACGRSNNAFVRIRGTVAAPASITGPVVACGGSTQTYTSAPIANTVGYHWSLIPASAGTISGGTSQTITVTWAAGYTTAQLCCHGQTTFNLDGPDLCITISNTPATPGAITGNAQPCQGGTETYSITPVAGATSYNWTVLGSPVIGQNGASITVTLPGSFVAGQVCVSAVSCAGANVSSPSCLAITPGQVTAIGGISGPGIGICGAVNVNYQLSTSGAASYLWSAPGATIVGGQGSNSINVTFPANYVASTISVIANFPCGFGTASLPVTGIPSTPTVTPPTLCANGADLYIASSSGGDTYTWTITGGVSFYSNPPVNSENGIQWGPSGNSFSVTANNGCGASAAYSLSENCRIEGGQELTKELTAELYPNPTHGGITLEFNSPLNGRYTVKITDLTGRLIRTEEIGAVEGLNRHTMDFSSTAKGMYLLNLQNTAGESIVIRMAVE